MPHIHKRALRAGAFLAFSGSLLVTLLLVPLGNTSGATGPATNYSQTYEMNTAGWCTNTTTPTPCNDVQGNYGVIDRVGSGFSNYGGYGAFAKSQGGSYHAVVSGTSALPAGGCPVGTTEYCQGPFVLPGGGTDSVFPAPGHGVTVSTQIYIDTSFATSWLNNASNGCTFKANGTVAGCNSAQPEFDYDVGLNNNTGAYLQDFVENVCMQSGAGGADGYVVSFSNSSPGSCSGVANITQPGWYKFTTEFYDAGGYGVLLQSVVRDFNNSVVASKQDDIYGPGGVTPLTRSQMGGPGYIWFPTLDFVGLPIDNTLVAVS